MNQKTELFSLHDIIINSLRQQAHSLLFSGASTRTCVCILPKETVVNKQCIIKNNIEAVTLNKLMSILLSVTQRKSWQSNRLAARKCLLKLKLFLIINNIWTLFSLRNSLHALLIFFWIQCISEKCKLD